MIGLGLITVVAYTMFVLSVALFGSVFSSQVDTSSPLPVCFGNDHLRREPVCLDLAFALCHDCRTRPCNPSKENISQGVIVECEFTL